MFAFELFNLRQNHSSSTLRFLNYIVIPRVMQEHNSHNSHNTPFTRYHWHYKCMCVCARAHQANAMTSIRLLHFSLCCSVWNLIMLLFTLCPLEQAQRKGDTNGTSAFCYLQRSSYFYDQSRGTFTCALNKRTKTSPLPLCDSTMSTFAVEYSYSNNIIIMS